jgi:hypothetical protein
LRADFTSQAIWSSEKTYVQDVGGRRDNCRNYKNREYRIALVPPHPASRDHPHQSKKEYESRHFKNQPETDDDCQQQFVYSPIVVMGLKRWL